MRSHSALRAEVTTLMMADLSQGTLMRVHPINSLMHTHIRRRDGSHRADNTQSVVAREMQILASSPSHFAKLQLRL